MISKVIESLKPWPVLIHYANRLAALFPSNNVKARRDFRKLLNLIYVCAFLHQHQRPFVQNPENKLQAYVLTTTARARPLER